MKTKAKKKRFENRINDYYKTIEIVRNKEAFTKPGSNNK